MGELNIRIAIKTGIKERRGLNNLKDTVVQMDQKYLKDISVRNSIENPCRSQFQHFCTLFPTNNQPT